MFNPLKNDLGSVIVQTTDGRGFTPEELAERALDKILFVGSQAHPAIRDQAIAFKDSIRSVIVFYMHEAIRNNKTTIAQKMVKHGYKDLLEVLND